MVINELGYRVDSNEHPDIYLPAFDSRLNAFACKMIAFDSIIWQSAKEFVRMLLN